MMLQTEVDYRNELLAIIRELLKRGHDVATCVKDASKIIDNVDAVIVEKFLGGK